jgi:hypothetical protein
MNEPLYRLVYLSRNKIRGDGNTLQKEISQILRSARENNSEVEITGALMFTSDYFAQVLEGPYDNVQKLFDRIEEDDRHSDMVMIDFSAVDDRRFAESAMAYVGEEENLEDRFFMIAEETNFDASLLSGNEAFNTLREKIEDFRGGLPRSRCA